MKTCKAGGCSTQTNGFSSLCERHKRTKARHGHPHQTGVKKSDLKPYLKEIESYLKTVSAANAKDILNDIWGRAVATAQASIDGATRGIPLNTHDLQASKAVVSLPRDDQRGIRATIRMGLCGWWA